MFSVSVDPDLNTQLIQVSDELKENQTEWEIYRLKVQQNYVGALVVEGFGFEISYFNWQMTALSP